MQVDTLFGEVAARVLLYLNAFNEGYAPAIASFHGVSVSGVQKQLLRLEDGGVLISRHYGSVRVFTWNPRLYGHRELRAFLDRAFESLPEPEQERYAAERKRPRRTGKPIKMGAAEDERPVIGRPRRKGLRGA